MPQARPFQRILVIKLADLGDVLTATPALRALRQHFPQAQIDVLLTHHTQSVLAHSAHVDNLIPSDNFRFVDGRPLTLRHVRELVLLLHRLRRPGYDTVLVMHHLTTRAGLWKYTLFARATGARVILGLRPPHQRAAFLTHAVPDGGFGSRHEIDYWLEMVQVLGAHPESAAMEMSLAPADEAWAATQLQGIRGRKAAMPVVIIHPGSGGYSPARRWAATNFAIVADALQDAGVRVVLVGTASDGTEAVRAAMQTAPVDLTDQTSLHQLAALLARANLFIGGDSGVTHLAAATGVPLVAVFGPSNAAAWGPREPHQHVLQADLPCSPCAYVGHGLGLRHGCAARTCLKQITPAQVLHAAGRFLGIEIMSDPKRVTVEAQSVNQLSADAYFSQAYILGTRVHAVRFNDALELIEQFIAAGGPHQVATVNPEFLVAAYHDPVFQRIINRAALAVPDGVGVLKAAGWLNQPPLPERVPGVDLVQALAERAVRNGYRLFLLGAMPGVAAQTAAILQTRYPGLQVVGTQAGSPRAADEDALVAEISAADPDIVLVAYGAPQQDKWIARNMQRLPAKVLIGVGGAFDFIAGRTQRAPQWMQRANLEWLHRLVKQPSRWRRIWNAVPRFTTLVWRQRWRERR